MDRLFQHNTFQIPFILFMLTVFQSDSLWIRSNSYFRNELISSEQSLFIIIKLIFLVVIYHLNKNIQPSLYLSAMNTLDYSKADISRAKTAEYYPGQSASGPFYSTHLKHSNNLGHSLPDSRVYPGDASIYYHTPQNHAQSYHQYAYQLAGMKLGVPYQSIAESQHVKLHQQQQSQQAQNHQKKINQAQSQSQFPTYYNEHARYLAQEQIYQGGYQRQFLPFRPMMASQINEAPQSRMRLNQRSSEPYHEYDFKVFCPACHEEYYNSQVQEHIERHYLYNTNQFKITNPQNLMNSDQEQVIQPLSNQSRFVYPLIQPQQFQCKELDEVNYLNKYKLYHEEMNKKESNVKVKSQSTQFAKPPLQVRSHNTDVYNCFDNIFNSKNSFSVNDLTKSNSILAKKRQLDDWQKLRSKKEEYKIGKL